MGAVGRLVDASGHASRFTVRALEQVRCVVDVTLPAAVLRLTRTLGGGVARHDVAFHGPAAPLFAALLGGRFRRLIGPTVAVVVTDGGRGAAER